MGGSDALNVGLNTELGQALSLVTYVTEYWAVLRHHDQHRILLMLRQLC